MRYRGRITSWKELKGFGFITPDEGVPQIFVHASAFAGGHRPRGNETVTYKLQRDERGRSRAIAVELVDEGPNAWRSPSRGKMPLLVAFGFLLFLFGAFASGRLPFAGLALYMGASIVTFLVYAVDKYAATRQQWRTQESTLHLLALVGGWPGAVAAQQLLRHKSAKRSFQLLFWLTVVVNCSALAWLTSAAGAHLLDAVFGSA